MNTAVTVKIYVWIWAFRSQRDKKKTRERTESRLEMIQLWNFRKEISFSICSLCQYKVSNFNHCHHRSKYFIIANNLLLEWISLNTKIQYEKWRPLRRSWWTDVCFSYGNQSVDQLGPSKCNDPIKFHIFHEQIKFMDDLFSCKQ